MSATPDVAVQQPASSHQQSLAALSSPVVVGAVWTNPNPPRPRGRAPKDPHAYVAKYNCASLQELEANLRSYLDTQPAPPEHSSCELTIWAGASFMVALPPPDDATSDQHNAGMLQPVADALKTQPGKTGRPRLDAPQDRAAMSVLDALQPLADPRETMKRQRAISKVCIASIQKVDGFRYSFHNTWKSGEDNAYRFSWYCNDSLLNKDRVANGKSGSQGKRATKPVYDCRGVLTIKFSATRQCIDVIYKHVPIHATYEERAPPPRKHAKRRADWDPINPEAPQEASHTPEETFELPPTIRKRSRKLDPVKNPTSTENDLRKESLDSLLLLIRGEEEGGSSQSQPLPDISPSHLTAYEVPASAGMPRPMPGGAFQSTPTRPARICEICVSRKLKCNGARPKCQHCAEREWPCFYTQSGPDGQPQYIVSDQPSQDTLDARALAALSVAQVGELKKELHDMMKKMEEKMSEVTQLRKSLEEQGAKFNEVVQRNKQLEKDLAKSKEDAANSQPQLPPPTPPLLQQQQQQHQPPQHHRQHQHTAPSTYQSYPINPPPPARQQQAPSYQPPRQAQHRAAHSQTYQQYQPSSQPQQRSQHIQASPDQQPVRWPPATYNYHQATDPDLWAHMKWSQ